MRRALAATLGWYLLISPAWACINCARDVSTPILLRTAGKSQAFTVFFERDDDTVSTQARALIDEAARAFANLNGKSITIKGHADASEPDGLALSQRRAFAVERALRTQGLPKKVFVHMAGFGYDESLIKSELGKHEPQNRNAIISIEY